MKKVLLIVWLLLACTALFAEETFESAVLAREMRQDFGNGALSVASNVYSIVVLHDGKPMSIEVNEDAFNVLAVGDVLRITVELKGDSYEVLSIKLLRRQS